MSVLRFPPALPVRPALPALLAEQPHSAPVQHWSQYLGWSAGLVLLVVLVYWLMRQGWKWRVTLQADLPPLPTAPEDPGPALLTASGRYHGSTAAGQWLERIVAHGLGTRSLAELTLTGQGLLVRRPGAETLWIPAGALTGARTDSGIAGKVVPAGLLVVTWRLGSTELDSGFRADHPDEHAGWVEALTRVAAGSAAAHAPATAETATPPAGTPETATPQAATPQAATPPAGTPETATPQAATPQAATPQTMEGAS